MKLKKNFLIFLFITREREKKKINIVRELFFFFLKKQQTKIKDQSGSTGQTGYKILSIESFHSSSINNKKNRTQQFFEKFNQFSIQNSLFLCV